MRVIVTGHMGYIGKILVPTLLARGHFVKGIDLGLYASDDFPFASPPIQEIRKDIRDIRQSDLSGFDAIIHLAALSNDPRDEWKGKIVDEINHLASVRLAELSKEAKIKRFVFSSSCSVYGRADDALIRAETDPPNPLTEYGKSKYNTEIDVRPLADENFSPIFMRNATVYGYSPSLRFDMIVNNFTASAFYTKEIKILGDGTPWRPLIHIQDLANIFSLILEAPRNLIHNQVYNVGFNEENLQIKQIAQIVQKIIPSTSISIAKKVDPDSRSYKVDFTRLLSAFNPSHLGNVERGVTEVYQHLQKLPMTREKFENKAGQRLAQLKDIEKKFHNFLRCEN